MKKALVLVLALALIACLGGCGSESGESAAPETAAPESTAPESAAPESETPESESPVPESEAPESEVPESEAPVSPAPESSAPVAETPAAETAAPEIQSPDSPAPEIAADPAAQKETAMGFVDSPVSALYAAIGYPSSSDYAPSCIGAGEDGNLYYNGFTVYTYRENGTETVVYVE